MVVVAKKKQWRTQGQVVEDDDIGSLSNLEQTFLGLLSGLLGCSHFILHVPQPGSDQFLFYSILY